MEKEILEENEYQKIKKMLNKKDDYFSEEELIQYDVYKKKSDVILT